MDYKKNVFKETDFVVKRIKTVTFGLWGEFNTITLAKSIFSDVPVYILVTQEWSRITEELDEEMTALQKI